MVRRAILAAILSLAPFAGQAQETGAQDADTVVSRGQGFDADLDARVSSFVDEIGATPVGNRGLARWNGPVCVGVENLDLEPAQYLVDRISEIALALDLSIGEPGCTPNVSIIFSADGQQSAQMLVDQNARQMSPGVAGTARGRDALQAFIDVDRPVRWWQVSMPTDARSGRPMVQLPGQPSYGDPDFGGVHNDIGGGSRLYSQARDDLSWIVMIVDARKFGEQSWTQIADYLAMISLAQIDPDADTSGFTSVLNVLDDPDAAPGLTAWDYAYLQALYSTNPQRQPNVRRNEITSTMAQIQREAE